MINLIVFIFILPKVRRIVGATAESAVLWEPTSRTLDFCAIPESESNVVPFKFVCEQTICFESHLFFLSFVGVNELKKCIFQ
jgi:hypothetical protein